MRAVMLGPVAALAAIAAACPAAAEHWSDPGFVAAAAVTVHRGSDHVIRPAPGPDDRRHDRRRDRDRARQVDYVSSVYGGEWARWNNRSWEQSSYNDWWHETPSRSFPRWMQNNGGCQRMWWSGGGWTC